MNPPPPGVLMDPPAPLRRIFPAGETSRELLRFLVLLGLPAIGLLALGMLAATVAPLPAIGLTILVQLEVLWLVSRPGSRR